MPNTDPASWPPGFEKLRKGAVLEIRGDKIITMKRSGDTVALTLSVAALLPFIPKTQGGGGGATLPTPQYQYMVYQGVATNVGGWDWPRAHPLP